MYVCMLKHIYIYIYIYICSARQVAPPEIQHVSGVAGRPARSTRAPSEGREGAEAYLSLSLSLYIYIYM